MSDHVSYYMCMYHQEYTVWQVIFGGANIREKLKIAVGINFCGFNFRDWMTHAYRICEYVVHGMHLWCACNYGEVFYRLLCVRLSCL